MAEMFTTLGTWNWLIFGFILIANYGVPGWGLALVWVGAVFAFIGGFFMIYQAFKQRKA